MNGRARILAVLSTACLLTLQAARGEVKVERVSYLGLANCYKLSNGTAEAIVTTDVGPRVIRYAFSGGSNLLAEMPEASVKTEYGDWKPLGGHRLWHAPEAMPRTYVPDNSPLKVEMLGQNGIRLTQSVEAQTGIEKEMVVSLDAEGTGLTILHRLTNRAVWDVTLAPWALTIVAGGGVTILPQEPYIRHEDALLPARPLVLWHYTDLTDPRWSIGKRFVQLKTDAKIGEPQKIGIANKQGWAAYLLDRTLFVKRFPYRADSAYPDYGSNCETYTAGTFMEVETLGPLQLLTPGKSAEHTEKWSLFRNVNGGPTEATLDAAITPLIAKTSPVP
jgi:hypothetical protein